MIKRLISLTILSIAIFVLNSDAIGQNCNKYFGKGYCTDYVKLRLGRRPTGDAGTWRPNINPRDARPGDAVIFSSPAPYGHVAVVERVIYERNTATPYQIEISEWNWSGNYIDRPCAVTSMFGKATRRTVRVNSIKGYWRP